MDINQTEVTQESKEEEKQVDNEVTQTLAKVQSELEEQRERYKDLSRRLTQAQQENAELYRYHKATLPKINQSFADKWEQSPEGAVETVFETKVAPVSNKVAQIEARQWETQYLVENPNMAQFKARVLELGDEHPYLTSYQKGISKLYEMAEAEVLKAEYKKLKANQQAEEEKERSYTEGSSSKLPPQKQPLKLDHVQRTIAQNLGIKEEDYIKQMRGDL